MIGISMMPGARARESGDECERQRLPPVPVRHGDGGNRCDVPRRRDQRPQRPWTQIDPANPTYRFSAQANVPSFGLSTVVVRDIVPMGTGPRFMRLRVTK